jgi:hypothetical protein
VIKQLDNNTVNLDHKSYEKLKNIISKRAELQQIQDEIKRYTLPPDNDPDYDESLAYYHHLKGQEYQMLKDEIQDYLIDGYEIFFIDDSKLTEEQQFLKHHPESWKRYYYLGKRINHVRI